MRVLKRKSDKDLKPIHEKIAALDASRLKETAPDEYVAQRIVLTNECFDKVEPQRDEWIIPAWYLTNENKKITVLMESGQA